MAQRIPRVPGRRARRPAPRAYSDGFDFDTEIILGLLDAGKRVEEVPIPTYYGDEICYVNGMAYARDVARTSSGTGRPAWASGSAGARPPRRYALKPSPHSSHGRILAWLGGASPGSVLDVGCSDGAFGALARAEGHRVVGVDVVTHDGVAERLDGFVEADLERAACPMRSATATSTSSRPTCSNTSPTPRPCCAPSRPRLAPDGEILVSVPNFGHWYPRGRTALGLFDYDARGPLDRGHLRFFTRRSFEKLVRQSGLRVLERDVVGVPLDVLDRGRSGGRRVDLLRAAGAADRAAVRGWPTLFGYQLLYRLTPA